MPARVWKTLAGLIVLLLAAVVGLDQWQARRGEVSLLGLLVPARQSSPARSSLPPRVAAGEPPQAPVPGSAPRLAVIVDNLGARRDIFDLLWDVRRPVAVAVLPGLPLSATIAKEAGRAGMEVLLDLPMEPYPHPALDPGPGALTMAMSEAQLRHRLVQHLEALPPVVGVITHLGSRLTEDRPRMRAVAEVLAARRLVLVDAYTSSLSVAYDEAKAAGVRAARRQVLIDHASTGEGGLRGWEEVAGWAERRGELLVVVHGHPTAIRALKEHIPRWEARGVRLTPVSQLAR